MSHHQLVAVVLLTAFCILVVEASRSKKGKGHLRREGASSGSGSGSGTGDLLLNREMENLVTVIHDQFVPSASSPMTNELKFQNDVAAVFQYFQQLLAENPQFNLNPDVKNAYDILASFRDRYSKDCEDSSSSKETEMEDLQAQIRNVWISMDAFEKNNPQLKKNQRVQDSLKILKNMKRLFQK